MAKIIEIKNLNFSYNNNLKSKFLFKKKKEIFKDFNFTLHEGETVIITGKNGIGKTTLLSIIAGQLQLPDSEKTEINYYLDKKYPNPFQAMGLGFQLSSYPNGYSVKSLIKVFFPKIKKYDDVRYYPQDEKLFEIFGIEEIFNLKIKKLSGGQRQKLTLLFCFYNDPKIILLDEFTNHLDIKSKLNILNYIKRKAAKNNLSIFFVTHNFDEISSLANRVLLIKSPSEYELFETNNVDASYISKLVEEID